jgi:hypothetical protein
MTNECQMSNDPMTNAGCHGCAVCSHVFRGGERRQNPFLALPRLKASLCAFGLIVVMVCHCFMGCKKLSVAGGGGMIHVPPSVVVEGEPALIRVKLWPSGRYTDVCCHYRLQANNEERSVCLQKTGTEAAETGTVYDVYECYIPALSPGSGSKITYYIDMKFDGHYNRNDYGPIPIGSPRR